MSGDPDAVPIESDVQERPDGGYAVADAGAMDDGDRDSLDLNIDWTDEGEVLSCPWHGWEYHLRSGQCLSRPDMKLPSYPVEERDGEVVVSL